MPSASRPSWPRSGAPWSSGPRCTAGCPTRVVSLARSPASTEMTPAAGAPKAGSHRGDGPTPSDPDTVSRSALVDALVSDDASPAQRRLYRSIIDTVAGLSADHAE